MINFCTLFDINYLSRGLTMIYSLERKCNEKFHIYVLVLDELTENYLNSLHKEYLSTYNEKDLDSIYPELKELKKIRTRAEYCWTLSSYSIQYLLKTEQIDSCTYLDSDLFFYADPIIMLRQIGDKSVLITEHDYTPCYDQSQKSGKYCVQFMYFKNNAKGNEVLEWWRAQCQDCCSSKFIDGKFGDQKYLDDWTTRFDCVKVAENGYALAPWNAQQYSIVNKNDSLFALNKITKKETEICFYHFHNFKHYIMDNKSVFGIKKYVIDEDVANFLYRIYMNFFPPIEQEIILKYNLSVQALKKRTIFFYLKKFLVREIKDFFKLFFFVRKYKSVKQELLQEEIHFINF